MSELADEKYNIASFLIGMNVFTLKSLKEKLQVSQLSSAVLTIIDDLLNREYIKIAEGEALAFNLETFRFDKKPIIAYEVVSEKREAFGAYIEELNKQRFQPDAQGRPRGPHYRVVEKLLESAVADPKTLVQQEATIEAYFEFVLEDEIGEQADLQQKEISEAYVRTLYSRFLDMKTLWEEALLQLLTASRLFHMHKLEELRINTQGRACEIFTLQYQQAQKNNQLYAFARSIMRIESKFPYNDKQTFFFFSLTATTLKEIATKEQEAQTAAFSTPSKVTPVQPAANQLLRDGVHYTSKEYYTRERVSHITQLANEHRRFVDEAINDRGNLVNQKAEEHLTKVVTNEDFKRNLGSDYTRKDMRELAHKLKDIFFPKRISSQNQLGRGEPAN